MLAKHADGEVLKKVLHHSGLRHMIAGTIIKAGSWVDLD